MVLTSQGPDSALLLGPDKRSLVTAIVPQILFAS